MRQSLRENILLRVISTQICSHSFSLYSTKIFKFANIGDTENVERHGERAHRVKMKMLGL